MIIDYHRTFKKAFAKLPKDYQNKTVISIEKFVKNPRDPSLGVHPLKGMMSGRSAFSVTGSIRVIFTRRNNTIVLMLDVGGHDQVY